MCTGAEIMLLAGGAGVLGGSALQGRAESRKVNAQTNAAQAELERQKALESRRASTFEEALEMMRRDRQQGEIDDATDSRAELIEGNTGLPQQAGDYESPSAEGAPKVVRNYADQRQGEANDFTSLLGGARARMGAWGDAMMPFQLGMQDASFNMDELGRQAMVSGQLGQQEAQNAYNNTGNRTAMAGNLATQLGGMAMQGGAQSHFGGGGSLSDLFRTGGNAGQFGGGMPGNLYGNFQGSPGGFY